MANVLTATVDLTFANVLLRTEFTATGSLTATVERSSDGGVTWTTVRGANPLILVGPAPGAGNRVGYVYDTEAPLNTNLLYRSTNNLGTVTTAGPVIITSPSDVGWLKDPARPWANQRFDDCTNVPVPNLCTTAIVPAISLVGGGLGTESYAADYSLFPILNAPRPADVYGYRKDAATSWRLVSKTLAGASALNTFYAWGGPIFIQLPTLYGWPDRYYQPDAVDVSRLTTDLRKPYRFWDTNITVVNAPVGAGQGTVDANWCALDDSYATYAVLAAAGFTWGDVVEGDAV